MPEALVLGGGGVAGIAWITGCWPGLADAGQGATGADVIVGTSAGATVGAQLGSGLGLEKLYARQTEPELQAAEIMVAVDLESFRAQIAAVLANATTVPEIRRVVGEWALAAATVPEPERRAVIEARLPSHAWPVRTLKIVAVDAESGEPRVFGKGTGVSLVDAVTASCTVPGVWPPATINGRRYVDGGVRSIANADYTAGASRVLVIVPLGSDELSRLTSRRRPSRGCVWVAPRSRLSSLTSRRWRRSARTRSTRPRASRPPRRGARKGAG
jgi:NTE family protein